MSSADAAAPAPSDVSAWLRRWAHMVAPGGSVLDVACGTGRHLRWFAARGHPVTGIDRDAAALAPLGAVAEVIAADIEAGPWPLPGRQFDAVVVTNYLWRERMPTLIGSLAPGAVLLYETFAAGNESVGKPSNPKFLLRPGELLGWCAGLRIVAFEDGFLGPPERFVQRIVAVRERRAAAAPVRYPLDGPAAIEGRLKSPDSQELA